VIWRHGQHDYLPSGGELAGFLAEYFGYPGDEGGGSSDLARVSQYASVLLGSGPLYEELHQLFDADYPPTELHLFLAQLPALQRERLGKAHYQLIVTTNYDDALERAFRAEGEPYDVVTYVAEGEHRGKFLHWPHEEEPRLIEKPNEYTGLALDERTAILKMHGAIDRRDSERDSFVITEDHYIDYLTRTDISNLVPVLLAARLRKSHFLFLGYSMRDWNLRVILHRIWGEQRLSYKSWAIQLEPEPIEQEFWNKRGVDILQVSLEDYVENLRREARAPLGAGVGR
jgi:SIR2-like domain